MKTFLSIFMVAQTSRCQLRYDLFGHIPWVIRNGVRVMEIEGHGVDGYGSGNKGLSSGNF